jgi:6-phosphogluconate dehydrogenase (decarboxylating)
MQVSDPNAAAAERGADYLDAPVSGGTTGAREGTLTVMVGGRAEAVERARPFAGSGRPAQRRCATLWAPASREAATAGGRSGAWRISPGPV